MEDRKNAFEVYCLSLMYVSGEVEYHIPFHLRTLEGKDAQSERAILDLDTGIFSCKGSDFEFVCMDKGHAGTCIAICTKARQAPELVGVKFYTRIPTPGHTSEEAIEESAYQIEVSLLHKRFPHWLFLRGQP